MHKFLGISVIAAGLFALSAGVAVAQNNTGAIVVAACDKPPCTSTTGKEHRSATANTKGANRKGFCPPGQASKPGKGSAFNC